MPTLARKLRVTDYFTLAFGTMVGVGWLVLMDDWLGRGGPLGAALGFALGGVLHFVEGIGTLFDGDAVAIAYQLDKLCLLGLQQISVIV